MRKMNLLYNGIAISCLASLTLFQACKKDVLESKDLLVYVAGDFGSVNNTVTRTVIHTPISTGGDTMAKIAVAASREVAADIDITLAADTSLVSKYNLANKTACLALPATAYQILNPGKLKIRAGKLSSDSVQIKITNRTALTNTNGYLLPLSIQSLEGEDRGARISTNKKTVYLYVAYAFNNIKEGQTPVTGTAVSRTGWGITVSNTTSGNAATSMVDGNNSTAWRSSNSASAAKTVTVDLLSAVTFKGVSLLPNYVAIAENPTAITVSTSTDNVTWTVQGLWKGTAPDAASTAAAPDVKGISFIAPVQARYLKLDITASNGQNRVGIGELNVIQ